MSQITDEIAKLQERKVALLDEKTAEERAANACEAQAREHRKRYSAIKEELGQIETALRSAGIRRAEESALAVAKQAQADAQQAKADAEKTNAEATELLAKLKEQLAASEAAAAEMKALNAGKDRAAE